MSEICFSTPSPKRNLEKMQAYLCPNENAGEEEKLLAFSYLFVPLLFLGMKGRERKKKRKNILMM